MLLPFCPKRLPSFHSLSLKFQLLLLSGANKRSHVPSYLSLPHPHPIRSPTFLSLRRLTTPTHTPPTEPISPDPPTAPTPSLPPSINTPNFRLNRSCPNPPQTLLNLHQCTSIALRMFMLPPKYPPYLTEPTNGSKNINTLYLNFLSLETAHVY